MEASTNWTLWLVLGAAAVVGYFAVSKIIDFYTKNSTYDADVFAEKHDDDLIGGHDPKKPIG